MTEPNTWYENEDFWHGWGPSMFSTRRMAGTPGEVDQIIKLTNICPPSHVLDLCCGIGRHSLELGRRGFRVTAVDRTAEYLKKAEEEAEKEGLNIDFIQEDMRKFLQPDTFDATINMFTSFGYFENQDEDRIVASNIHRSLKPRGLLVMEMSSKEILARVYKERDWREVDGTIWLEERKIIDDWSRIQSRWITFKNGLRYENTLSLRLYSATELKQLLQTAGFARVNAYGGLDAIPYDNNAQRLVMVAYKSS